MIGFMLVSVAAKAYLDIGFTIPCLIKATLGVRCPGCGLTTAAVALARLDVARAWEVNPLVFVLLLALPYYTVKSFRQEAARAAPDESTKGDADTP